jgi:CBS domain-containing protein
MRSPAPCVALTDTVNAAARAMKRTSSDVVLVLDNGKVAGIVTVTDLVRLLGS